MIETRWCVHCVIYHLSSAPPPTPRAEKWRKRRTCDDVTMRVRDDSCYVPWEGSPCFCFRWSTPALVGSFDLGSFGWEWKKNRCPCDPSKIFIQKLKRPLTNQRSAMIDLSPFIIKEWWETRDLSFNPPFSELRPPCPPLPPVGFPYMQKSFGFLNDTSPIVHRWFGTKMLSSTTNCLVLEVIFIKGCKWTEYIFLTMEYHSLRYFVLQVKWSELPPK